jgi:uncharacterized damage-inducible protein DinB
MLTETLRSIYKRDLELLREEIAKFGGSGDLWCVSGEVTNSAGNLCLHICGNLQHFLGAVLGESGYGRNRDAEFSRKDVNAEGLLAEIDATAAAVDSTLAGLGEEDLAKTYPIEVFGHPMTTEYFLVHLATHLNYHLGQINYHRRLIGS